MGTPRTPSTLRGGLGLDPDLPLDNNWDFSQLRTMHALRHLQRHLEAHGSELVLIGELSDFAITCRVDEAELERYRWVESPHEITRLLRWQPQAVPLFTMVGSLCVGLKHVNWDGVKVARHMRPGRRFAFIANLVPMMPADLRAVQHRLHLCEWRAPFPRTSIVSWGNDASLLRGPKPIAHREAAARGMYLGEAEVQMNRAARAKAEAWFLAQEELQQLEVTQ